MYNVAMNIAMQISLPYPFVLIEALPTVAKIWKQPVSVLR